MELINKPVLVLNAAYEPINITRGRRAISLMLLGKADVEQTYDLLIRPDMFLPSVIRLKEYRHLPARHKVISKTNIFMRDKNTCQYCGLVFSRKQLTLDHVIPKSRGGQNTWKNLVTCCSTCNRLKDDRTPEEAKMVLRNKPREMTIHTSREIMRFAGSENNQWRQYLYFDSTGINPGDWHE